MTDTRISASKHPCKDGKLVTRVLRCQISTRIRRCGDTWMPGYSPNSCAIPDAHELESRSWKEGVELNL